MERRGQGGVTGAATLLVLFTLTTKQAMRAIRGLRRLVRRRARHETTVRRCGNVKAEMGKRVARMMQPWDR